MNRHAVMSDFCFDNEGGCWDEVSGQSNCRVLLYSADEIVIKKNDAFQAKDAGN
jgi:hypothetical protein